MIEKTYMKFNPQKGKEYIYTKDLISTSSKYTNIIGKTLIDFLAHSDEIIEKIKSEFSEYELHQKIVDLNNIYISVNLYLKEINPLFIYFNFNDYFNEYVKDIINKNNTNISILLEKLSSSRKRIKYLLSEEKYNEELEEVLSDLHDYDSKESKKAFKYIEKAEKNVNDKLKKYKKKYNYSPSHDCWKKLYKKDINAQKGEKIINDIDSINFKNNKQYIESEIQYYIKTELKSEYYRYNLYKKKIKRCVKIKEKTLNDILNENLNQIKYWIDFSKYILIHYYNLSDNNNKNNLSSSQRLLNYLLQIRRTYIDTNIFKIPESEITMDLKNNNQTIDLNTYVKENRNTLFHDYNSIFKTLSSYNVNIVQEYRINNIENFICASLIQILQYNIKLCQCKNCGKLFIPVNKSNEKYCTYKYQDNKTCRDLSYSINLKNNELSNILRKKYRTENAKKNRNKHIPNIEQKFSIWYNHAKEYKIKCERNEISLDEFIENINKKWF